LDWGFEKEELRIGTLIGRPVAVADADVVVVVVVREGCWRMRGDQGDEEDEGDDEGEF
jgi:hypothetical protein